MEFAPNVLLDITSMKLKNASKFLFLVPDSIQPEEYAYNAMLGTHSIKIKVVLNL